jgi:cysteine sulfinate desulfinase/cysteine desulfurase-like protein
MNVPQDVAFGAIRFSVGRYTTRGEIDQAIQQITAACDKIEAAQP